MLFTTGRTDLLEEKKERERIQHLIYKKGQQIMAEIEDFKKAEEDFTQAYIKKNAEHPDKIFYAESGVCQNCTLPWKILAYRTRLCIIKPIITDVLSDDFRHFEIDEIDYTEIADVKKLKGTKIDHYEFTVWVKKPIPDDPNYRTSRQFTLTCPQFENAELVSYIRYKLNNLTDEEKSLSPTYVFCWNCKSKIMTMFTKRCADCGGYVCTECGKCHCRDYTWKV